MDCDTDGTPMTPSVACVRPRYNRPGQPRTMDFMGLNEKFPLTKAWVDRIGKIESVQRGMSFIK